MFNKLTGLIKGRSHSETEAIGEEGVEKFDPNRSYNPDVSPAQVEQERRNTLQQQGLRPLTSAGPVVTKGQEFVPDQNLRAQAQVIADQKWKEEQENNSVNATVGVSVTPQSVADAVNARQADEQAAREAAEQAAKEALLDQRRKENIARVKAEQEANAQKDAQKAQKKAQGAQGATQGTPRKKKKTSAQASQSRQQTTRTATASSSPAKKQTTAKKKTTARHAGPSQPVLQAQVAQPMQQPVQPAQPQGVQPMQQGAPVPVVAPNFASQWNAGPTSASAGWDDEDTSWGSAPAQPAHQMRHQAQPVQQPPMYQQPVAQQQYAQPPVQQPQQQYQQPPVQQPVAQPVVQQQYQQPPVQQPQPRQQRAPRQTAPQRPLSPTDAFVNQAALSSDEVETMANLEEAYTPAPEPAPQQPAPVQQPTSMFQTGLGQVFIPPSLRGKDDPEDLNRPHNFTDETTRFAQAAAATTASQAGNNPDEPPTEEEIADDQNGYSKRERARLLEQAKKRSEKKSVFRLKGVYFPGSDD